jgi:hypothetical protein
MIKIKKQEEKYQNRNKRTRTGLQLKRPTNLSQKVKKKTKGRM